VGGVGVPLSARPKRSASAGAGALAVPGAGAAEGAGAGRGVVSILGAAAGAVAVFAGRGTAAGISGSFGSQMLPSPAAFGSLPNILRAMQPIQAPST
jgi:hypothetical protein